MKLWNMTSAAITALTLMTANAFAEPVIVHAGKYQGSGTIVSGDRVITAAHVFDPGNPKIEVVTEDGQTIPAQVLVREVGRDVMILKTLPGRSPTAVDCSPPMIGEPIRHIGSPGGWQFFNSFGHFSMNKTVSVVYNGGVWDDVLLTDIAAGAGSSGGSILNLATGYLRGILVGGYGGMGGPSIVVPASTFCDLLEDK